MSKLPVGGYVLGHDSSIAEILEVHGFTITVQDGPIRRDVPAGRAVPAELGKNVCETPVRAEGHETGACRLRHVSPDDVARLKGEHNAVAD